MNLDLSKILIYNKSLSDLPEQKILITTINAHCYNIAQKDPVYAEALKNSDILLPDGISIVYAIRFLIHKRIRKIAGADLFYYEMARVSKKLGTCFFLGSSEHTLNRIVKRAGLEYPGVKIFSYSPPFKPEFSSEDNRRMVDVINDAKPDVLFIGLTAPKQEKWAFEHFNELSTGHICCIGAVFDFYAGTVKRAPEWLIYIGMEWAYRLIREPRRLWRRYILGNIQFIKLIVTEKHLLR